MARVRMRCQLQLSGSLSKTDKTDRKTEAVVIFLFFFRALKQACLSGSLCAASDLSTTEPRAPSTVIVLEQH